MPAVRAADEWRKVLEVLLQQQQVGGSRVGGSDRRCCRGVCINISPVELNISLDSNNTLDSCSWVSIALNSARLKQRWRGLGNSGIEGHVGSWLDSASASVMSFSTCLPKTRLLWWQQQGTDLKTKVSGHYRRTLRGKHSSVHCLSIPCRPPTVKVLIPHTPTVWGEQVGLWEELWAGLKLRLKHGTP